MVSGNGVGYGDGGGHIKEQDSEKSLEILGLSSNIQK